MIPEPMPLFVLTGFLGSGKTTLLQRVLRAGAEGTGVLINEFGEAGLDHRIVAHVAELKGVVQAGCICCSVRPELTRGLLELVRSSLSGEVATFRRLVIETSGLSDPAQVINTVQSDRVLREYFRVSGVITTIDTVNALRSFDAHPEVAKQVALADTIVLTKGDIAPRSVVAPLLQRIRAANPLAEIIDGRTAGAERDLFTAKSRFRATSVHAETPESAGHDVQTFSMSVDGTLNWPAFVTWLSMLLNRHGERVLRVKGILNVDGSSSPVLVHGVQHIMHPPEHMPSWPDEDHRSRLVFIVQQIEPDAIRDSLRAFLSFANSATRTEPLWPEAHTTSYDRPAAPVGRSA